MSSYIREAPADIRVGRVDSPGGWHRDKWHVLTVFILTLSMFLDIKHLVVSLFTMAFLRICVSTEQMKDGL